MAALVAKKKGNQLYYYVVESARVDGQPAGRNSRFAARSNAGYRVRFWKN
jgi:hypothetical protein